MKPPSLIFCYYDFLTPYSRSLGLGVSPYPRNTGLSLKNPPQKEADVRGTTLTALYTASHLNKGCSLWVVTPKRSEAGSINIGTKVFHQPTFSLSPCLITIPLHSKY
jgi:hypothetical protein